MGAQTEIKPTEKQVTKLLNQGHKEIISLKNNVTALKNASDIKPKELGQIKTNIDNLTENIKNIGSIKNKNLINKLGNITNKLKEIPNLTPEKLKYGLTSLKTSTDAFIEAYKLEALRKINIYRLETIKKQLAEANKKVASSEAKKTFAQQQKDAIKETQGKAVEDYIKTETKATVLQSELDSLKPLKNTLDELHLQPQTASEILKTTQQPTNVTNKSKWFKKRYILPLGAGVGIFADRIANKTFGGYSVGATIDWSISKLLGEKITVPKTDEEKKLLEKKEQLQNFEEKASIETEIAGIDEKINKLKAEAAAKAKAEAEAAKAKAEADKAKAEATKTFNDLFK
ncbi:MAG: hypothetical protein LBD17_02060 [Endomicrobium sp.]|jgi:hypothetical protein|nr:hypothetical protein [Endomicrobium sp.]